MNEAAWCRTFNGISDSFRNEKYDVEREKRRREEFVAEHGSSLYDRDWHKNVYTTDRSLDDVTRIQGVSVDFILDLVRDKIVVDVGGGYSRLQEEISALGVKTTIVNLDLLEAFTDSNKTTRNAVIGSAHQMPFASESVDVVLSTFGVPTHAHSSEIVEGFYNEMLRVLKVGGVALTDYTGNMNAVGDSFAGESWVRSANMIRSMSSMPQLDVFCETMGDQLFLFKKASFEPTIV